MTVRLRQLAAMVAASTLLVVASVAVSYLVRGGADVRRTPTAAAATSESLTAAAGPGAGATRRLVWDESIGKRHGIHLRTARVRGAEVTKVRSVYDTEFGFTLQLRLDGRGRRVAFVPCCRSAFPSLVVVDLGSRAVREPLTGHPQFYAVGAVGWSPDGTRLAFEGFSTLDDRPARGLYTVGLDGTDLRTVVAPEPFGEDAVPFENLVWSTAGILYPDAGELTAVVPGDPPTVIGSGVQSVQLSGDGRWLFTVRDTDDGRSLWRSRPDGSEAERVRGLGDGIGAVFLPDVVPDRRGRRLLGVDGPDNSVLRTWRVGQPLDRSVVPQGVTGSPYVATWH